MQFETRPPVDVGAGRPSASRRPIRIVAPTASGRRWRTAGRAGASCTSASARRPGELAVFLAAFEPRRGQKELLR
jgi:hypothetical protein